jgi:hypothetical protein
MDQGLDTSIWAHGRKHNLDRHDARSRSLPPPIGASAPSASPASTSTSTRLQSFHRFEQTCQRLRWKFIDLESSYNRALAPAEWGFTAADAERNFKVDFHEFYAWIEQSVVFLLLVFGVTVQRGPWRGARTGGGSTHAYHHNVLMALAEEENPLHGTLGRGDVSQALWKAKELRNRWKDAAEGRETPPLKMYDLRWIVTQVLRGLEDAYMLAAAEVEDDVGAGEQMNIEDGWEWMVESMDWEEA